MLSTCACTETSSAEVGSSHTRNSGCVASARAIEMRWRWPPENWCGNFSMSAAARPTDCSSSADARVELVGARAIRPCSRSGSATMSRTRPARVEARVRILEDHLHAPAQRAAACGLPASTRCRRRRTAPRPRVGAYRPDQQPRHRCSCRSPTRPPAPASCRARCSKLTPSTACTNCRGLRSSTRLSQGAETSKILREVAHLDQRRKLAHAAGLLRHGRAASRPRAWRRRPAVPGRSMRQRSNACGQRGWNAQPRGMAVRRGIAPSICSRRSRSSSIAGIEPISPTV